MSNEKHDLTEQIGKQSAALSLGEIGLGSILHSLKIPLAGHFLSINQIAIISRATFKLKSTKASLQISLIAACLKSLSPAGKRLTPMLAIAAQGLFFYVGVLALGINRLGLILAVLLSSLWAFLQPILFIYIIFGKGSLEVVNYLVNELQKVFPHAEEILLSLVIGLIIAKFILAYCISFFVIKMSDEDFEQFQKKMIKEIKLNQNKSNHSVAFMALKDLLNPLFIFSFILTTLFFFFSHSSSTTVQGFWFLLRPLAIGYILFYFFRVYPPTNFSQLLKRRGFHQLSKILDEAISVVNNHKQT
jgi:hypothetical protein